MNNRVNIRTDVKFPEARGQSALLKCLLRTDADAELFERSLAREMAAALPPDEKKRLLSEKLQKIAEWRTMLASKFEGRSEEREFCLLSLGHLISAHYSGKAQSLAAIDLTLTRLINAISGRQPIIFTFCFGGYKCHTSLSHPEVDWAELFHLNFLVSYLYPIIKTYKYGIEIEYESEEVSLRFNNVPQDRTDRYTATFRKLLDYYSKISALKYGLQLTLRLVVARDQYREGVNKLYELIDEKKPAYRDTFDNKLTEREKTKWIQRASANYMWDQGIASYGPLSEHDRYEIIKEARISNEAFLEADYLLRQDWFENKYRVPFVGTWGRMPSAQPFDGWLHLKSTNESVVDCWIGTGFLEIASRNGIEQYRETILSQSQVQNLQNRITYLDNPDEELKQVSANFNRIPSFRKES
jgi:hypothetical protein